MNSPAPFLSPSEAARQLAVSPKALRLYEQRGLVTPACTGVGWRVYGAGEMARAADVVALRVLGLSLAQITRVLAGEPTSLEGALASHQTALESQLPKFAAFGPALQMPYLPFSSDLGLSQPFGCYHLAT